MDGCDLKSVSDEALITLFHTAPLIHQLESIRIVRISKDLVIKGGDDIRASEAATMDYASAMTDVLLPKVHRVVHRDPDKIWGETCLIVMDFIHGSTLQDCWETLNEETRANIVNQVAKYISSLQAVQVAEPPGPIGGRDKFQGIWFSYYGAGPFSTRKALEDWFNLALTICKSWGRCPQDSPPNKFKTLCLVHQDIFPRNLILHPSGQIWLIDWGNAGLYPPAFERGALTWKESEYPDFVSRVLDAIPSHQQELKALSQSSAGLMTAAVMQL